MSQVFLVKALALGFSYIWQLVMCRSSQRRQQKGFTNAVLMCQPSLSLCTAFVPGDIKVYSRCWAQLTAVTCLNCFPVQIFKWSSEGRDWLFLGLMVFKIHLWRTTRAFLRLKKQLIDEKVCFSRWKIYIKQWAPCKLELGTFMLALYTVSV